MPDTGPCYEMVARKVSGNVGDGRSREEALGIRLEKSSRTPRSTASPGATKLWQQRLARQQDEDVRRAEVEEARRKQRERDLGLFS